MPCLKEIIRENEAEIQRKLEKIKTSIKLYAMVLAALEFGRFIACKAIESEISARNNKKITWRKCRKCKARLENKENKKRSIKSLVGKIEWKRKIGICPNGCEIGQQAPLDKQLGLVKNQRSSDELRYAGCILAIFIPYGISSFILKALTGINVCPKTIWNWCQIFGKKAEEKTKEEMLLLDSAIGLPVEKMSKEILSLPLVIGGDGVFVPMRPNEKSPEGKIKWKEVKVGIFARMKAYITKKGEKKSRIANKRLVAVRTDKDLFTNMMELEAHKQQIKKTKTVAWISDGGKGFWSLYDDLFSSYIGILDFYHAAQYLWKFARIWLDGRTNDLCCEESLCGEMFCDRQSCNGRNCQIKPTIGLCISYSWFWLSKPTVEEKILANQEGARYKGKMSPGATNLLYEETQTCYTKTHKLVTQNTQTCYTKIRKLVIRKYTNLLHKIRKLVIRKHTNLLHKIRKLVIQKYANLLHKIRKLVIRVLTRSIYLAIEYHKPILQRKRPHTQIVAIKVSHFRFKS